MWVVGWVKKYVVDYGGDLKFVVIIGGFVGGYFIVLVVFMFDNVKFKSGFEDFDCCVDVVIFVYGIYDFVGISEGVIVFNEGMEDFLIKNVMLSLCDDNIVVWEMFFLFY